MVVAIERILHGRTRRACRRHRHAEADGQRRWGRWSPAKRLLHRMRSALASAPRHTGDPSSDAQLVEQGLGIVQVGGVESFGEPGVDRRQQVARVAAAGLASASGGRGSRPRAARGTWLAGARRWRAPAGSIPPPRRGARGSDPCARRDPPAAALPAGGAAPLRATARHADVLQPALPTASSVQLAAWPVCPHASASSVKIVRLAQLGARGP